MTKVCSKCGIEKQLTTEFFYRKAKGKEGFRPRCIECQLAEGRTTERKQTRRNGHLAAYELVRKAKEAQDMKCGKCGVTCVHDGLDFAHIDEKTKYRDRKGRTRNLNKLSSVKLVKEELPKGRFLCIPCHKIETLETRIKSQSLSYSARRHRSKRQPRQDFVNKEKLKRAKCFCGCGTEVSNEPHVLQCFEFDHREGVEKINTIANMVTNYDNYTLENIAEELLKCDLRFAGHHRAVTRERLEQKTQISIGTVNIYNTSNSNTLCAAD